MIEGVKQKLIAGNLYKNPELDSWLMAEKMGVEEEVIKKCVMDHFGLKFTGFLNGYRMDLLIDCMNKEIIFDRPGYYYIQSDFKSRSPFERCFRKRTGMTVQQYIVALKRREDQ